MINSILLGISNFILCYFTCWLFFSKKLNFLSERDIENYEAFSNIEDKIRSLELEIIRFRKNKRDNELIKGIFKNTKNPGQTIELIFKLDIDSEKEIFVLEDAKTYSLPYYLIRRLSNDGFTFEEI